MDAFAALYERYYQDVYRFALFLTGDPMRAEDLASETFVRAWVARGGIRHPTVRAYLLAITRNLCRDQLRLKRPWPLESEETRQDERPGIDVQVEYRSERHQRLRIDGQRPTSLAASVNPPRRSSPPIAA